MKELLIVSNLNLYEYDKYCIFGTFYISINDFYFPCHEWTDLITSVLDGWLFNTLTLLDSSVDSINFFFMDGPYYFNVSKINKEFIHIKFWDHEKLITKEPIINSFYNFCEQLLKVTHRVLYFYDHLNNSETLQEEYKELKDCIESLRKKNYMLMEKTKNYFSINYNS